jgi:HlyD family secretion protein
VNLKVALGRNSFVLLAACLVGLGAAVAALAPTMFVQEPSRVAPGEDQKHWQTVAPGRVEPRSGEIKVTAPVVGRIGEVLVKPRDEVFAGELMIRLQDDEARARLATADAQVAMRKRARDDGRTSSRERRRADDAIADAERAVVSTRAALDAVAIRRRAGKATSAEVEAARTAYARAQERVRQARADLQRLEADGDVSLPVATEGQFNVAQAEWMAAEAAVEKLAIRAPIGGTVLQVNAKVGELAGPAAAQPLLVMGDISALRVRAEVDERDFADIKVGQVAVVRAPAFRDREIAGKVSSVAPIVDAGRAGLRGQRGPTDVNVVEVVVDVPEPGPLAVGMKVDVYFRPAATARQ